MTPLGGLDALFLHLETAATPMHVGALHLLDAAPELRAHVLRLGGVSDALLHRDDHAALAEALPRLPWTVHSVLFEALRRQGRAAEALGHLPRMGLTLGQQLGCFACAQLQGRQRRTHIHAVDRARPHHQLICQLRHPH